MERFKRQHIDVTQLPDTVRAKWSADVLNEGFVPVPKKFIRCLQKLFPKSMAVREVAALLAVVDFKRPNLQRLPSEDYLSHLAGLSRRRFRAALERLEDRGYAKVTESGTGIEIRLESLEAAIEEKADDSDD